MNRIHQELTQLNILPTMGEWGVVIGEEVLEMLFKFTYQKIKWCSLHIQPVA